MSKKDEIRIYWMGFLFLLMLILGTINLITEGIYMFCISIIIISLFVIFIYLLLKIGKP